MCLTGSNSKLTSPLYKEVNRVFGLFEIKELRLLGSGEVCSDHLDYILEDDRYEELMEELQKKKIAMSSISRYELEAVSKRMLLEMEELMVSLRTLSSVKPSSTII